MDVRASMPAMLRHKVEADEKLWAHLVSQFISPPVVWAIWVVFVALNVSPDLPRALAFGAIFAVLVCALPMLFVAFMVRIGKIGDLHMRNSRERYIPYAMAIIAGFATEWIFLRFDAHPVLVIVTLVCIVELSLMLCVTFFYHISLHAMAMTSVISATTIVFGFQNGLIFVPVLLLVVVARLVLRRHTASQIVAGALIGTLTPLVVVAALPFFM